MVRAGGPDDGFLSTLPVRGATIILIPDEGYPRISIHAPREGSDRSPINIAHKRCPISIHAPREGSDYFSRTPWPGICHFYPRSP